LSRVTEAAAQHVEHVRFSVPAQGAGRRACRRELEGGGGRLRAEGGRRGVVPEAGQVFEPERRALGALVAHSPRDAALRRCLETGEGELVAELRGAEPPPEVRGV